MEILRYKSDVWGQRVLEGASWDLIWVFAAAAVVFIVFHAVAVVVIVAIATGLVMMVGIDGPFWERNPFIISESSRGLVFVLRGFAGLVSITMIMVHVYFAIRPEKMYMTRSMFRGWISREEYEQHHDPELWSAGK